MRRLAHPFWFQSFGAVMGMDWHSSGITTSVIGALKRGLGPLEKELGIHVCGGRGKYSRQTPHELVAIGEQVGFDGAALATASRLVAKVDSAAVQDAALLAFDPFTKERLASRHIAPGAQPEVDRPAPKSQTPLEPFAFNFGTFRLVGLLCEVDRPDPKLRSPAASNQYGSAEIRGRYQTDLPRLFISVIQCWSRVRLQQ